MKEQLVTLDINRLTSEELEAVAAILYYQKRMDECKAVNDRIAFVNEWMNEKQAADYYATHCA